MATENWNDTANGTAISFFTTPNGGGSVFERMRIDNSGNVGIGTTNPLSLLHVGNSLFEHPVMRRDHHDRHGLVDQRDRTMLELARRVAFGVDVGDFL